MLAQSETVWLLFVRHEQAEPWSDELRQAVDGLLAGYEPTLSPLDRQMRLRVALRQGRDRLALMRMLRDKKPEKKGFNQV